MLNWVDGLGYATTAHSSRLTMVADLHSSMKWLINQSEGPFPSTRYQGMVRCFRKVWLHGTVEKQLVSGHLGKVSQSSAMGHCSQRTASYNPGYISLG